MLPNEAEDVFLFFLWSKVYQQIHLALVGTLENEQTALGISFPEYQDNQFLGKKLRVFAESEQELERLNLAQCLSG